MKKVCIVSTRNNLVSSVKKVLSDVEVIKKESFPVGEEYDLIALSDYNNSIPEYETDKNIICSHLSLLPAFDSKTPIKDAFVGGVKVTGITVYRMDNKNMTRQILAQYPVMIDIYTSYPQLEEELFKLEDKLLPLVIKSVLEDKVFDIVELLNPSTHCGGCRGCGKCQ